ncbi:asparagine synthetase B, partial [Lentzea sp. PSKA42]
VGSQHHNVIVTADDFRDSWAKLSWHRDAPLSEPADVAVFRLAELARRDVKVVLSGEGSDELFGGYPKYRFAQATRFAGALPSFALRRLEKLCPLPRHGWASRSVRSPNPRTQNACAAGSRRSPWPERTRWLGG